MHVFQVRRSVCMRERKTTHPPADRTPTIIHQQHGAQSLLYLIAGLRTHAHCSTNIALDIIIGFGAYGDAFPQRRKHIVRSREHTF